MPRTISKMYKRQGLRRTHPSNVALSFEAVARLGVECYQLRMKQQYLEDDKLFIFPVLAADETWDWQCRAWFRRLQCTRRGTFLNDAANATKWSKPTHGANMGLVRVNDFRASIKIFIAPQPQAVPNTKRFFH
jgi:hypothetical protein